MRERILTAAILLILIFMPVCLLGSQDVPAARLWISQPDNVYLQESVEKVFTEGPVLGVGIHDSVCFVIMDGKLSRLEKG